MIQRGLDAGLVGENGIVWAIADSGRIHEAGNTNIGLTEYHGYPVRSTEAIAEAVCRRFRGRARNNGNHAARRAVRHCRIRYGFR